MISGTDTRQVHARHRAMKVCAHYHLKYENCVCTVPGMLENRIYFSA